MNGLPSELLLVAPFTVVVDTREKLGYQFAGLRADAADGRRPLAVPTMRATLGQGDYSIQGLEASVAVERKSVADLYGTLGQGRSRFVRELERLSQLHWAAVVVEGDWSAVLEGPDFGRLNPKTVFRSVIAWQQRFPTVHWWMVPDRRFGEVTTYRMLERFWKEHDQRDISDGVAPSEV